MTQTKKCKAGKSPVGKNGRCVKVKTKKCKAGKSPVGKNGRCVKTHNRSKSRSKSRSGSNKNRKRDRQRVHNFMNELGDDTFFTKKEVDHFVKVGAKYNLNQDEFHQGLEQYPKGYGIFEE